MKHAFNAGPGYFQYAIVLLLQVGIINGRDTNNRYSPYNIFIRNYDIVWSNLHQIMLDELFPGTTAGLEALTTYHTTALLALGARGETQEQLLDALSYFAVDSILGDAALLNRSVSTYGGLTFQSYADLYKRSSLAQEFDRLLARYIPVVTKRRPDSKTCDELATMPHMDVDDYKPYLPFTSHDIRMKEQGVCFTSYTDFKATWINSFGVAPDETFVKDDGTRQTVAMMSKTSLVLYAEDNEFFNIKMLTIPLATLDSSLLLIMPSDGRDIAEVIRDIYADMDGLTENVIYRQAVALANVRMPRFKVVTDLDLIQAYSRVNVKKIFTEYAENDILKNAPNSVITNFSTKISLEIDENGVAFSSTTETGNINCDLFTRERTLPPRKTNGSSPFSAPALSNLLAEIAQETLTPGAPRFVEYNGTSPFMFAILTTDMTLLTVGTYQGS